MFRRLRGGKREPSQVATFAPVCLMTKCDWTNPAIPQGQLREIRYLILVSRCRSSFVRCQTPDGARMVRRRRGIGSLTCDSQWGMNVFDEFNPEMGNFDSNQSHINAIQYSVASSHPLVSVSVPGQFQSAQHPPQALLT